MNIDDLVTSDIGHKFSGEAFRELCGHIVYVFMYNGRALYVGMSSNGLGRAAAKVHKSGATAREDADEVMVWSCKDKASAKLLEEYLIHKLKPLRNHNGHASYVTRLMGLARTQSLLSQVTRG